MRNQKGLVSMLTIVIILILLLIGGWLVKSNYCFFNSMEDGYQIFSHKVCYQKRLFGPGSKVIKLAADPKTFTILAQSADKFENTEVYIPVHRLLETGFYVDIAAPKVETIFGEHGYPIQAT